MGADYIEQDVVLTADDHPIVLHDIHLELVTDVAERFPRRARADGRFYAIDFTLAEIQRLRVRQRIDLKTGKAVYPRRFPVGTTGLRVPTLAEEIQLVQGLNESTGRSAGIYPEIKSPAWHRRQGKDISRIVLEVLARFGYQDHDDLVYVQCFDAKETKRLRTELKSKLKLVQLIGKNNRREPETDFERLRTPAGLKGVAEYADGIGPRLQHIVTGRGDSGELTITSLVDDAHAAGLEVHPYTFHADDLPKFTDDFDSLLRLFVEQIGVDGLFTDFPDKAITLRNQLAK
jgi:glycerophosphoryl diester phosphodiesterase